MYIRKGTLMLVALLAAYGVFDIYVEASDIWNKRKNSKEES